MKLFSNMPQVGWVGVPLHQLNTPPPSLAACHNFWAPGPSKRNLTGQVPHAMLPEQGPRDPTSPGVPESGY